jgi:hypothetical protein
MECWATLSSKAVEVVGVLVGNNSWKKFPEPLKPFMLLQSLQLGCE